jgi:hypothetical protein
MQGDDRKSGCVSAFLPIELVKVAHLKAANLARFDTGVKGAP